MRGLKYILLFIIAMPSCTLHAQEESFFDWVDRTFFGFDSTYVYSYPSRLTLTLQNRTWKDMYKFDIDQNKRIDVHSDYLSDLTFSIGYRFLSVGYTVGMNKLTGDDESKYNRFDLSLKCNMLTFDLSSATNESQTTLYATNNDEEKSYPFWGLKTYIQEASLTYYFKHQKYSNEAAYSSSYPYKQIRSAGSPIIGLYYGKHDIKCDLSKLPHEIDIPSEGEVNTQINNQEICINGGYGYNFVFAKGWLLNGTALPSVGLRLQNNAYDDKYQFATNSKLKAACTYNSRYLFGGIVFQYSNYWYITKNYTIRNSIGTCTINIGVRL